MILKATVEIEAHFLGNVGDEAMPAENVVARVAFPESLVASLIFALLEVVLWIVKSYG